ncbi:MAG: hypothetical protein IKM43_01210 [Clostridia bacterium]|nr:hypothetical protein [Clostridia bacterium]
MEEIEKLTQEERDAQELENLKVGYQHCKDEYNMQNDRFKSADAKLNMLLVFNVALLALLTIAFPLGEKSNVINILFYIFLSLFAVSMLITLISIIMGLFPKTINYIMPENFIDDKFYHCTNLQFYGKMIGCYTEYNIEMNKKIERKHLLNRLAMISSIFNIVFMFVIILITVL